MTQGLPDYADRLLAFHRAHRAELERMIGVLPVASGARWLDLACGDGSYLELLAARGARPVGCDLDQAYLALCNQRRQLSVPLVRGDARRLPFADGSLDGALCAQSFYSLPQVPQVLAEMRRVVAPGGCVAVMENDRMHHVMLPWPPGLEARLRVAEHTALVQTTAVREQYPARQLGRMLREVGLSDTCTRAFASHRRAPLSEDERTFLGGYLDELFANARNHLGAADLAAVQQLVEPSSPEYLLDSPDLEVTYLDVIAWAKVPT